MSGNFVGIECGKRYTIFGTKQFVNTTMPTSPAGPVFSQGHVVSANPQQNNSNAVMNLSFPLPSFRHSQVKSWRKTIALVSLFERDSSQPCSSSTTNIKYNVITNIVVVLNASKCDVETVSGLVEQQVGVEVVLMDCKCYALHKNPSTSGSDFWKGTRKILATSN